VEIIDKLKIGALIKFEGDWPFYNFDTSKYYPVLDYKYEYDYGSFKRNTLCITILVGNKEINCITTGYENMNNISMLDTEMAHILYGRVDTTWAGAC